MTVYNKIHKKQLITKFSHGKHARITTTHKQHIISSEHQPYLRNRFRDEKNTSAARTTNCHKTTNHIIIIGLLEINSSRFPEQAESMKWMMMRKSESLKKKSTTGWKSGRFSGSWRDFPGASLERFSGSLRFVLRGAILKSTNCLVKKFW